jgi:hypothetical protein
MIIGRSNLAVLALTCAISIGTVPTSRGQDAPSQSYDSSSWSAPRGYDLAYPENGTPNMVARQGYAAGFNQGQADASRGKKFKPTDSDAYEHAKVPKGFNKDEFKQTFHEAFVKGYSNGYKG